jgi:hypothetical protein
MHTRRLARSFAALVAISMSSASADPPSRRPVRLTDEVRDLVVAPADAPLDDRIDPDRITTLPTPEVPGTLLLPMPPVHRIAADRAATTLGEGDWTAATTALDRGLDWLAARQSARGAWMEAAKVVATDQPPREAAASVAVTAMALKALAQASDRLSEPQTRARDRARDFVLGELDRLGLEGLEAGGLGNYVSSAVVMGLSAMGTDTAPGEARALATGVNHLVDGQWSQEDGVDPSRDWFGGGKVRY